jgi:hypothetical protein
MDLLLPYIQLDVKYKNSCKDKFFAGILMRNLCFIYFFVDFLYN